MKIKITEEGLKINEERIKVLRATNESYVDKMVDMYRAYLKELSLIIDFLTKERYYFTHPDYNEMSTRGPILGKNKKDNILYVYNIEDNWVNEINMYYPKDEPKRISLRRYFLLNDFEEAMKGLISLVNYQDEIINQLEEENKICEALLEKYELIIAESQ